MQDKVILGKHEFETLVAITEDEHIQGLMYKPFPPPIMSFPFNNAETRKFWMRNTISPLDIIFCCDNEVLDICQGQPLSLDLLGPDQPVDLVIEMPAGTANTYKISIGDYVDLKYSVGTVSKKISEKIRSL